MGLRTIVTMVREDTELFNYLKNISLLANNLYNATLFRMRQILTAANKDQGRWTDNEKGVQVEIDRLLEVNSNLRRPTRENPYVSYPFVYHLMYVNRNPDYFSDGLPSQTGQQVMKNAVQNMKAFYKAKADWRKHPKKYSGEPKLPGYKKSGGQSTYCFTNQQVRICGDEIRFPCTDITAKKPKNVKDEWTLKQVNVVPNRNVISLQYVFEDHQRYKEKKEPNRIVSIDLGIKNFAAMTNNIDQPGILFKGGWLRHINYWYNQKMSSARSSQTEGTTKPFHSTARSRAWGTKRENRMNDYMHKVAKIIIKFCEANEIDTLVIGDNKGWKQKTDMGKDNNRDFVSIPHDRFKQILEYLCDWNGINYVEQEESYTSQASYLEGDEIPVYREEDSKKPKFSGYRSIRGTSRLYQCGDGRIVNSDLNGSANIGRKAFPELYRCTEKTFNRIRVYRTMDELKNFQLERDCAN